MHARKQANIPVAVYVLALGIFAMINCELQVLGMMPQMASDLEVSIAQVGYLVSIYAAAMAIGGPMLTLMLGHRRPKGVFYCLFALFIAGEILGAMAVDYLTVVISRVVTGAVAGVFFGMALGTCHRLVSPELALRAVAIVLAGIMVGTILGLPLASLVGESLGWRMSFWWVVALAMLAAAGSALLLPDLPAAPRLRWSQELLACRQPQLWAVFATSFCVIGTSYAAFSYFVPILTQLSGLEHQQVTWLLLAYGIAMLLGNHIVARLAGPRNLMIIAIGLLVQCLLLGCLIAQVHQVEVVIVAVLGLGLTGISMNPALVSRVMQVEHDERPFVNTLHASVITLGIMFGSYISGQALEWGYSLYALMWVGIAIAVMGLLTLLLDRSRLANNRALA